MSTEIGMDGVVPIVQVQNKRERELELKVRDVLLDKRVTGVYLSRGQLLLKMEDGGELVLNNSEFVEVS